MIRATNLKWVVITILLFVILPSCQKEQPAVIDSKNDVLVTQKAAPGECDVITDLLAGQFTDVGDVYVTHDEMYLYITYLVNEPGWCLQETHMHVAANASMIPQTKRGNPKIGHFDYQREHDCITEYTYEVPIQWAANAGIVIAAHAVVSYDPADATSAKGGDYSAETAWADGMAFPGNSWAMYFDYVLCFEFGGGIGPESEIAYAYAPEGTGIVSACFLESGIADHWGWELGPIYGSCTLEMWALPFDCDLSSGFHVGNVEVVLKGGKKMDISISTFPGYSLQEAHLWVSDQAWNATSGVDPEDFPIHAWDLSGAMQYTFRDVPKGDRTYMILHALVYGVVHYN